MKCTPDSRSMKGTTVSTLRASSTPLTTPIKVPTIPISAPCTIKIAMMLLGEAPSVRRMAISPRLSFTTITKVETMLKAATATISVRITNITVFSVRTALKKLA
jgi:hypothetical protein